MSTEAKVPATTQVPVGATLSLRELGVLLVKHYALTEGLYDLMLEYQIGLGAVGPDKDHLVPGAMIGVSGFGLVPSINPGVNTIDAAVVNPAKKPRRRASVGDGR